MENLNKQLLDMINENDRLVKRLGELSTAPQVDNEDKRMLKDQNEIMKDALTFYMNLEHNKGNYNSIAKNALWQVKLVA